MINYDAFIFKFIIPFPFSIRTPMAIDLGIKKKDFLLLFLTRALRMASYGMIAIVMVKNL